MSSKTLANQFRSTFVYGTLNNLDNNSSSIQARAAFQRDVFVGGNLFLGKEELDASGAFLDSSSNIQYTFNKEIVNFPVTSLRFIKNVTSDVQQQIIDLSNNITNNGGGQSSTFTDLTVSGLINGNRLSLTGDLECKSLISGNRLSLTGDLECKSLISGNRLSLTGDIECKSLISASGMTFSESLNNISATVFGFLSGVTSSIQNQIDSLSEIYQTIEGMENYQTKIDAANFLVDIEENFQSKIDADNFAIYVEEKFVVKSSNNTPSLPRWYITGAGGNGTTPAGFKIGAGSSNLPYLNTVKYYFSNVSTNGGASIGAFNTLSAIFRAPVAGTYFFQLNLFKNVTNTVGRNLRFVSDSFMGSQYCHFNEQSTDPENAFQWTAMIYLGANGVAYFETEDNPITLFYAPGHTNLTITKIF